MPTQPQDQTKDSPDSAHKHVKVPLLRPEGHALVIGTARVAYLLDTGNRRALGLLQDGQVVGFQMEEGGVWKTTEESVQNYVDASMGRAARNAGRLQRLEREVEELKATVAALVSGRTMTA